MKYIITILLSLNLLSSKLLATDKDTIHNKPMVAMHLLNYTSDAELARLGARIPEYAEKGINLIFLEVDYSFDFESHPELRYGNSYITLAGARKFAQVCRKNNIRLVPEFQSLGHQSWAGNTFPLLTTYPELDLTPGAFPGNKDIYCREWDPTNPKVNKIVFSLIDEIVDAFQADGIHVGMDEVFLLGSEQSPSTKGKDPAALFAKVVNEFHGHFVKEKKLQMFMWGDRLIDGKKYSYGDWEASNNGTASAIDLIPKDVVICDWHYETRDSYLSVPLFLEKGFKVLPCSYKNPEASKKLIKYSLQQNNPSMVGHMFTSWGGISKDSLLIYPAFTEGMKIWKNNKIWDVNINLEKVNENGTLTIALSSDGKGLTYYYTLDGSDPGKNSLLYKDAIVIDKTVTLKSIAYKGDLPAGEVCSSSFVVHLATGKNVNLKVAGNAKYPTVPFVLVNGITSSKSFSDGQWSGFEGQEVEAIIDLKKITELSEVSFHCYNAPDSWIYPASKAEVWTSSDGVNFQKAGEVMVDQDSKSKEVLAKIAFAKTKASYAKIIVPSRLIPKGAAQGGGYPAWIFIDEFMVK